jgi:protein-tyrosine-phosphatase
MATADTDIPGLRRLVPPALLRALRELRHTPDRLLHRSRQRRLRDRLRRHAPVRSALFICHGNINRSAYAAAAFARAIPPHARPSVRILSAGFIGPDRPASTLATQAARRRGIDLTSHRSRLIDPDELRASELIVVMNRLQADEIRRIAQSADRNDRIVILGDLDPEPIRERAVLDPYGHPAPVFEAVFDRIDRCIGALVRDVLRDESD